MLVRYQLEPIGVDGAFEAVRAIPFCSEECRKKDDSTGHYADAIGSLDDFVTGTVCEGCGKSVIEEV